MYSYDPDSGTYGEKRVDGNGMQTVYLGDGRLAVLASEGIKLSNDLSPDSLHLIPDTSGAEKVEFVGKYVAFQKGGTMFVYNGKSVNPFFDPAEYGKTLDIIYAILSPPNSVVVGLESRGDVAAVVLTNH